jgi:ATP-dependent Clp protease ATP-binding subunit ClpC
MAEDILHGEISEGDRVIITQAEDGEELDFDVEKGEAPDELTEESTDESSASITGNGGGGETELTDGTAPTGSTDGGAGTSAATEGED